MVRVKRANDTICFDDALSALHLMRQRLHSRSRCISWCIRWRIRRYRCVGWNRGWRIGWNRGWRIGWNRGTGRRCCRCECRQHRWRWDVGGIRSRRWQWCGRWSRCGCWHIVRNRCGRRCVWLGCGYQNRHRGHLHGGGLRLYDIRSKPERALFDRHVPGLTGLRIAVCLDDKGPFQLHAELIELGSREVVGKQGTFPN